jgi:hypothetical protein
MGTRQSFTREFKLEAVRLLQGSGRPAAAVARKLGVRRNQLYKWHEQLTLPPQCSGGATSGAGQFRFSRRMSSCRVWHFQQMPSSKV